MAILAPRWLDFSWQVRLQMCLKFCMVQIANRTRAQTHSTISDIVLCVWALVRFAIFTIQNFRHICNRTCQLKSSHLGTKIAITFTIFGFRSWFYHRLCRINYQTRVSRPFLGPSDLFFLSKVMKQKPSKPLNYEKAARSDLRLVQCASKNSVFFSKIKNRYSCLFFFAQNQRVDPDCTGVFYMKIST
jgi:hypothetical protein